MKYIGIIGAMDCEVDELIKKLSNSEIREYAGNKYYKGVLNGADVVITRCGIGKVNAACRTQAMIDNFDLKCIINTGVAGGIKNGLQSCDIVISTDTTYHDFVYPGNKPFGVYFDAEKELISAADEACKNIPDKSINHYIGRVVSGDQFISDNKKREYIKENFEPYCVEMEGAAIGHCCNMNSVPFVIIRSISDSADDNAEFNYNEFEIKASAISSAIVCDMVKTIGDVTRLV